MLEPDRCPLCYGHDLYQRTVVNERPYWRCRTCLLTFVPPEYHLPEEEEEERYRQHNNDPHDPRYREFLSRLIDCVTPHLAPGSRGLDYGSGPGPTIQVILEEQGHHVTNFDTYFAFNPLVFSETYDFVTCSETAEHFFNPISDFSRMDLALRPGGVLGVMTGMLEDDSHFPDWWYLKDPTHVCFYRTETMHWLAHYFGWSLDLPRENVSIFKKSKE